MAQIGYLPNYPLNFFHRIISLQGKQSEREERSEQMNVSEKRETIKVLLLSEENRTFL